MRDLRPESMESILERSVCGLTLKSTTCSTVWVWEEDIRMEEKEEEEGIIPLALRVLVGDEMERKGLRCCWRKGRAAKESIFT